MPHIVGPSQRAGTRVAHGRAEVNKPAASVPKTDPRSTQRYRGILRSALPCKKRPDPSTAHNAHARPHRASAVLLPSSTAALAPVLSKHHQRRWPASRRGPAESFDTPTCSSKLRSYYYFVLGCYQWTMPSCTARTIVERAIPPRHRILSRTTSAKRLRSALFCESVVRKPGSIVYELAMYLYRPKLSATVGSSDNTNSRGFIMLCGRAD
ncbi:hypothetical protein PHLGIDRAFT_170289 [Phlebiopsis gigantea 11061_1 CR5-6]|uniref:Uncharacterized protein n=1 Tax=Phlebiopsis gigantea (strain 11061_1 CR5-6) TaxID=745531 RepID=A0A0C3RV27_PHLG1|nr:hypothetical protein PHLGIDRAFT_170289 [Phlebiopsis gigantea 11061_1 CR5-6]